MTFSNKLMRIASIDSFGRSALLTFAGQSKGLGVIAGFNAKPFKSSEVTSGRLVSLENLRGKHVLLDFGGTWCQPCKEILPSIKVAKSRYSSEGFEVVGIAFDKDLKLVRQFISKEQMSWLNVF